ncbi:hypothetical protein LTR94_032399, partial [Friedmanniomyces endolithicus]
MILGGDLNIGGDRNRIHAFFTRWARAGMGFVAAHLGGARRALADSLPSDAGTHRDLEQASARGKDWLFARDDRGRPMRAIHAAVPFGTEVEGAPLSDHFGGVMTMIRWMVVSLAALAFAVPASAQTITPDHGGFVLKRPLRFSLLPAPLD